MRQTNAKLFRYLFHDKQSFRKFKKAYSGSSLDKRLKTIETAKKIKATGSINHMEVL